MMSGSSVGSGVVFFVVLILLLMLVLVVFDVIGVL